MNVEIGTEAAQFPEKEYITGIFLAVQSVVYMPFTTGKSVPSLDFDAFFLLNPMILSTFPTSIPRWDFPVQTLPAPTHTVERERDNFL